MAEIHIDAKGMILGRIGTYVAKKALEGHTVKVFNCEEAVISGSPSFIKARYHHAREVRGQHNRGPFFSRMPDRFFRRLIRGMYPMCGARGREAFARTLCYIGVPTEFKGKQLQVVEMASASKLRFLKRTRIGELCRALGGKI